MTKPVFYPFPAKSKANKTFLGIYRIVHPGRPWDCYAEVWEDGEYVYRCHMDDNTALAISYKALGERLIEVPAGEALHIISCEAVLPRWRGGVK